ncbi:MAG: hypothetical protein JJ902_05615 [Roseibium sp.]|nr:hypothetical protein [Roseibium sp.]
MNKHVRHPGKGGKGGRTYQPPIDHAAVKDGRTVFPSTVKDPDDVGNILKSGHHNPKIGKKVTKGRWKGFPIYTLTLEERKTCPRDCALWRACYGNNMHQAQRWRHGPDLELFLELELRDLAEKHPGGFVVRLHVLGDFYSVNYVRRWHLMLEMLPQLHVFGFTARIDPEDPITKEIAAVRRAFPDRWYVRFSGTDLDEMQTLASEVVDMPDQAHRTSIVCPEQTGKTAACATCGLCWHSTKNIAFLRH